MTTQALPTVVPFDKRRDVGNRFVLPARRVAILTAIGYRSALGLRSAAPIVSLGPVYPAASASVGGIGKAHALTTMD